MPSPTFAAVAAPVLQLPRQSSEDAPQAWPCEEIWTSMKSHMPPQRPGPQAPRWNGLVGAFAVAERNVGLSLSASVETTITWSQGREPPVALVAGKLMAMCPGAPAAITGKLTSRTPGGAIIFGALQVAP